MERFGWSGCAGLVVSLMLAACGQEEEAELESPWSAPELVSDGQSEFAISPHGAAHPAGVHLVWTEGSEDVMSLRARHFDIASRRWEETRDLGPADVDWLGSGPEVATDATGNAVVVWLGEDEAAIQAARYDREKDRWGEPSLLDATGWEPHVVMDADGNALAVWTHIEGDVQAYAAHMTPEGTWSRGQPIDAATEAGSLQTDVVLHADGRATAFMVQRVRTEDDLNARQLAAVHYVRTQDEWTPPVALQRADVGEYFDVSLAGNAHGDAALFWSLVSSDGNDDQDTEMYTAVYDSSSKAWTEPDRLTTIDGCRGALAMSSDGRATVVCSHFTELGSTISAIRTSADHALGAVESVFAREDYQPWAPAVLTLEDQLMVIWSEDNGPAADTMRSSSFRDGDWQAPELMGSGRGGVAERELVGLPDMGVLAYWTTTDEIVTSWHPLAAP